VNVCPVEHCITLKELAVGAIDPRTGRAVQGYASWTTHPNNPQAGTGKADAGSLT
jgi:dihydropyrimidine dehydrogenase (NAD+) subunit PreA